MPNKTQPNSYSVEDFLRNYANQKVIPDCFELLKVFKEVTHEKPVMWNTMIGFGSYHYKYESGREGDFFVVGFAPSKTGITLYVVAGYKDQKDNLAKLGKHRIGKSCLYIKDLQDVNKEVLADIIRFGYKYKKTLYEQK